MKYIIGLMAVCLTTTVLAQKPERGTTPDQPWEEDYHGGSSPIYS